MPKVARELSPIEVRNLQTPGYHTVGGVAGLYLQVTANGGKTWILRAKVGNQRRDIGLGGFPSVTLAQAREKAREMREDIAQGLDPVAKRKEAQDALRAAQARYLTFEDAARRYHQEKATEFRSEKHRQDWVRSLEMYAFPMIGTRSVDGVSTADVLEVLNPIWHTKTETATRVRQRMESVFSWAIAAGRRSADNPAKWDGKLKHQLANPSKITSRTKQRALPWQELPGFMASLHQIQGMGARALEFAILTAARSGEVRFATWDEIDFNAKVWTVPAERIKAGKEHKVPLSDAAINLLKGLPGTSEYVFTNTKGNPLSDMTLSAVLKRMDVNAVPHGFRSTFKDWARSCTNYADEVSELALAHVSSDATRAAYARDALLPLRKRLMQEWSTYALQEVGHTSEREAV